MLGFPDGQIVDHRRAGKLFFAGFLRAVVQGDWSGRLAIPERERDQGERPCNCHGSSGDKPLDRMGEGR